MGGLACTLLGLLGFGFSAGPASASSPVQAGHDRVLYSFGGSNGAGPLSGVTTAKAGALYGTTAFGGAHGDGVVFKLTPDGTSYTETILHAFGAGNDGATPGGNVIVDRRGDLFGETVVGGSDQQGTAYELRPTMSGYSEKVIHTFTGGSDGGQPIGALVMDQTGNLYGVTQFGGTGGGVVFELSPKASGYGERVLHDFPFGGALPQAGLSIAAEGPFRHRLRSRQHSRERTGVPTTAGGECP